MTRCSRPSKVNHIAGDVFIAARRVAQFRSASIGRFAIDAEADSSDSNQDALNDEATEAGASVPEGSTEASDANDSERVDEAQAEEADDSVRATIDIVGCSSEFGQMLYTMSIVANDELTTIDVVLKRPVGMLTGQHYQFLIAPVGTDHSSVEVRHTLDVRLMQRKLNVIKSNHQAGDLQGSIEAGP